MKDEDPYVEKLEARVRDLESKLASAHEARTMSERMHGVTMQRAHDLEARIRDLEAVLPFVVGWLRAMPKAEDLARKCEELMRP